MNKSIATIVLATLVLLSAFAGAVHAQTLPLVIDRVEIDDHELETFELNKLSLERDQTYDVEVKFTPFFNMDDVEIRVFVSGYEYNDLERISDNTALFDADSGVTYTKRLQIRFPGDAQEDDYRLRVMITDRNSEATIQDYRIKLDVPRHKLQLEDVYFQPTGPVHGGQALLTSVRLENKGERSEDDVRVTVSVPELGLSATDYIEEIEAGAEVSTEEIFMQLPACAKPGIYTMQVKAEYDELTEQLTRTAQVVVEENPMCKQAAPQEDVNAQLAKMLAEAKMAKSAQEAQAAEPAEEAAEPASDLAPVRQAMEYVIFILVVLLVIIGLIFAVVRMGNKEF